MSQEINFLARQQEIHASRVETDRKATLWLIALVAATVAVWGSAYGINWYFRRHTAIAQAETKSITEKIAANANSEQEYLNFYEKITKLQELLNQRLGGTDSIVYTYAYFGQTPRHDSTVVDSTYDYTTHELVVTIGCSNVFCVSDVMNLITAPDFKEKYPSLLIASLSRQDDATYQIVLDLNLQGGNLTNFEVEASDDIYIDTDVTDNEESIEGL